MAKIKEIKNWRSDDIRRMCVRNDFYTMGDNLAYCKMLSYVDTEKPTANNIYKVAVDIVRHSDLEKYGQSEVENIQSVMFEIGRCIYTHYEIA